MSEAPRMQTMQPVLLYGQYEWEQNWLPTDEFETRLRAVRRVMADKGWAGLIVHGDSQENGLLCYLTQFIPNQRWGLALIAADRPPRLIAPVGPRDLPAVRRLTWVQDIRATSDIAGALDAWLQEIFGKPASGGGQGKIGFADLDRMRFDLAGRALDACRGYSLVEDASPAVAAITRAKRPRELALLRLSYACLQLALDEVEAVRSAGGGDRAALLAGERSARMAGAQDVRILCSAGDGTGSLRPIDSRSPGPSRTGRVEALTVYFALRRGGYWAEAMLTLTEAPSPAQCAARQALAAAAASVRANTACRDLFRLLEAGGRPDAGQPLLGTGIRRAGGLSLDAEPWMQAGSDEALVENGVYTMATGFREENAGHHVLLSTTVLATPAGHEILWPAAAWAETR